MLASQDYQVDFIYNLEDYLLKDDSETNDNLKQIDDFEFLNSSLDMTSSKHDTLRRNSALFSFNDSLLDPSREKKIRKESKDSIILGNINDLGKKSILQDCHMTTVNPN